MDNSLRQQIIDKCAQMGIPMVGIAPVVRWEQPQFEPWIPEPFRPDRIFPQASSVIVLGLPVSLPVIETTPSIYYHELYRTINSLLDQCGYLLSNFLNSLGHPSVFVPRDGYGDITVLIQNPVAFFSHKHAAYLAGLGTFGVNNTLLTKAYGPRVRFTSVFTSAEIPPDPLLKEDLCIRCMACVRHCPVGAIDGEDYPAGIIRKDLCARYSEKLRGRYISPCGVCIRVCPVGEDRVLYGREGTSLYDNVDDYPANRDAWEHVRRYGGKG